MTSALGTAANPLDAACLRRASHGEVGWTCSRGNAFPLAMHCSGAAGVGCGGVVQLRGPAAERTVVLSSWECPPPPRSPCSIREEKFLGSHRDRVTLSWPRGPPVSPHSHADVPPRGVLHHMLVLGGYHEIDGWPGMNGNCAHGGAADPAGVSGRSVLLCPRRLRPHCDPARSTHSPSRTRAARSGVWTLPLSRMSGVQRCLRPSQNRTPGPLSYPVIRHDRSACARPVESVPAS